MGEPGGIFAEGSDRFGRLVPGIPSDRLGCLSHQRAEMLSMSTTRWHLNLSSLRRLAHKILGLTMQGLDCMDLTMVGV